MKEEFSRTISLIGLDNQIKLNNSYVCVFGLGGVGSYVCEALARSGIGKFDIVDKDKVSLSNINRQIIATHKTLGLNKVDVMKERILDINNEAIVNTYNMFYLDENKDEFDFSKYDYVIDCIDTVSAKISIIEECKKVNTKVISSMGTGNKLNPMMFKIADINQTKVCPLAKVMRYELRKRGITKVKVLYSEEEPINNKQDVEMKNKTTMSPSSISFTPSIAGLLIAREVILDLISEDEKRTN